MATTGSPSRLPASQPASRALLTDRSPPAGRRLPPAPRPQPLAAGREPPEPGSTARRTGGKASARQGSRLSGTGGKKVPPPSQPPLPPPSLTSRRRAQSPLPGKEPPPPFPGLHPLPHPLPKFARRLSSWGHLRRGGCYGHGSWGAAKAAGSACGALSRLSIRAQAENGCVAWS